MDFNFIPPKPPDISIPNSPAAYVTVHDDSSSSVSSVIDGSSKPKKKEEAF